MRVFLLLAVASALLADSTPAEQAIAQARQSITQNPKQAEHYSALGLALVRRARETADASFYDEADQAVAQSLALTPNNFPALKTRAWVLLGRNEFEQARDFAKELNQRMPDDVSVYGLLADVYLKLGDYPAAEKACNWMLRLRPGNTPALTRAGQLREVFGDLEGAIDLLGRAFESTPVAETEERVWLLTRIGLLTLQKGDLGSAEKILREALTVLPRYHHTLAALAQTKLAQKDYPAAVELFRARHAASPRAANLYDYAGALAQAGRRAEAKQAFAEFVPQALAESQRPDNSNHELVFYYANHARQPKDALRIAAAEFARRRDVHTVDAYAWALHVNGRDKEAGQQYDAVRALGTRDVKILERAAQVGALTAAR